MVTLGRDDYATGTQYRLGEKGGDLVGTYFQDLGLKFCQQESQEFFSCFVFV